MLQQGKKRWEIHMPHFQYKQKLMLIILCFLLVPLTVIITFSISWVWKQQMDNILNATVNEMDAGVERVNNLYLGSLYKIEHIKYNALIRGIMYKNYKDKYDELFADVQNVKYIISALNPEAASNDKLYRISIFAFNNTIMSSEYIKNANAVDEAGGLDPAIKDEVLHSQANVPIWKHITNEETGTSSVQRESVCLYEQLVEVDQPLAIIEIKISMSRIKNELSFDIPEGSFLVYSAENNQNVVVYRNGIAEKVSSELAGKLRYDSDFRLSGDMPGYYSVERNLKISNHKVILFIDKGYIAKKMVAFILLTVFTVILLIVTLVAVVRIISFSLTRRLSNLIANINIEGAAGLEDVEVIQIQGEDEFALINSRFEELVHRMREYYGTISNLELEKKIMEVELLQAGINPHFLYNTLSAIKWAYEDERLAAVIDSMVKYYRIMLNRGNMVLKLEQELQMIQEYLEIQKFAYRTEFSHSIHVQDRVRECRILKGLLQPVVENAFLHGINSIMSGGILSIEGYPEVQDTGREALVLTVRDNGAGMTGDKLEKVLKGESEKMYGGYGLSNVISRIRIHYGQEYGMEVTSVPGEGTSVRLTLPLIY